MSVGGSGEGFGAGRHPLDDEALPLEPGDQRLRDRGVVLHHQYPHPTTVTRRHRDEGARPATLPSLYAELDDHWSTTAYVPDIPPIKEHS